MITSSQPNRLDYRSSGNTEEIDRQLGPIVESADRMFEILFRDLNAVESAVPDDTISSDDVAVLIAAAPRYSVLTNGYAPDPELVFSMGDVIDVRVA